MWQAATDVRRLHTLHADGGVVSIFKGTHPLSKGWEMLQQESWLKDHYLILQKKRRRLTYRVVIENDAHHAEAKLLASHLTWSA